MTKEVEMSQEDFQRAVEALRAANVPEPYFAMVASDNPFYLWLKENYEC